MLKKRSVTLLGATGSIGQSTLKVMDLHPDHYSLFAVTANSRVEEMVELVKRYRPQYAVMACERSATRLKEKLADSVSGGAINDGVVSSGHASITGSSAAIAASELSKTTILSGEKSLEWVASHDSVDIVMAAIVGAAGLLPTLAATQAGKRILFANKEALVMAGDLFRTTALESGATLLPIDSEHNAIFQCLPNAMTQEGLVTSALKDHGVEQILLTASGGPFLHRLSSELSQVTPDEACSHPNWEMGRKISVDSATMMNKGLELIEACWLFNTGPESIQVVIHPQSVIHSMVSYRDGSVLAQLGSPDMCTPIAYGLGWPDRIESGVERLDLFKVQQLQFVEPNGEQFPCLTLARTAASQGGAAPIVLNAANEVAVAAFLEERLRFDRIAEVVAGTLDKLQGLSVDQRIESILEVDQVARTEASAFI